MFDFFHRVKNNVLDFVLPRACFACGAGGTYFCKTCFAAQPSDFPDDLPNWIVALKSYRAPAIRNVLWKLKYAGTQALADDFGIHLHKAFSALLAEHERAIGDRKIVIVPIPVSKKRYRERGYNQAELLARALARHAPSVHAAPHGLFKQKNTLPQAKIKRRKNRLENMHHVFSASARAHQEKIFANAVVILIDDIVTTGATLQDARRAVLQNGAALVFAICIAH